MKNYAYISIVTSENYLEGLVATCISLRQTLTEYPIHVLIPRALYDKCAVLCTKMSRQLGLHWITYDESVRIPDELRKSNNRQGDLRFNYTFDKLKIFELTQFEKLVFIDSDIYILQNLDHLFELPHMSAMIAGASFPGNEDWVELTSGIMTIVPQEGMVSKFENIIPDVMKTRSSCGDQDVLQFYYTDWTSRPELNMGEKYGVIAGYARYYEKVLGYHYDDNIADPKSVAIIHFAGESKPWFQHWSRLSIIKQELKLRYFHLVHQRNTESIFLEYKKLIREIRKMLRRSQP